MSLGLTILLHGQVRFLVWMVHPASWIGISVAFLFLVSDLRSLSMYVFSFCFFAFISSMYLVFYHNLSEIKYSILFSVLFFISFLFSLIYLIFLCALFDFILVSYALIFLLLVMPAVFFWVGILQRKARKMLDQQRDQII